MVGAVPPLSTDPIYARCEAEKGKEALFSAHQKMYPSSEAILVLFTLQDGTLPFETKMSLFAVCPR